ncbi:MAG: NAD-dependent epimerase/dehydratase family protein [Planctomycetes bacterium]|nr:NAD-dependent epimerase/dehydratase family protein [Planctomycetota bacterium]
MALVTGGTGLLGSHIAEQLRAGGVTVRAVCRSGADVSFLRSIGVQVVPGDLTDPEDLRRACDGVDTVYHAAARVGDWGPWADFVRVSIDGTRHLLTAAAEARVRRFLHISSISVYGYVNGEGKVFDETAPLGVNLYRWAYYTRAKVEAERMAWQMHAGGRLPVTVIRPSWLYGPRDRATLPRLIESLRLRKLKLIGDGANRLNVVHAGNVAEASILAAQSDRAAGEAYNCSHDGVLTQREYFRLIAQTLGEPEVTASVPYGVARTAAFVLECFGHLFRTRRPPLVTRYAVWLMGRRCFFECRKIKDHLGWSSRVSYAEGIPAAVRDVLGPGAAPPVSRPRHECLPARAPEKADSAEVV